jgi:hypothetical protein
VISGDTLVDFGRGLEINERWLRNGVTREEIAEGSRALLEPPCLTAVTIDDSHRRLAIRR